MEFIGVKIVDFIRNHLIPPGSAIDVFAQVAICWNIWKAEKDTSIIYATKRSDKTEITQPVSSTDVVDPSNKHL